LGQTHRTAALPLLTDVAVLALQMLLLTLVLYVVAVALLGLQLLLILNLLVICVGLLLPFHLQHVHRRKRRRQITQRHTGLQFAGGYYSCRGRASRGGRSSSRGFTGHEEGIGRRKGGVGGLVCVCACM